MLNTISKTSFYQRLKVLVAMLALISICSQVSVATAAANILSNHPSKLLSQSANSPTGNEEQRLITPEANQPLFFDQFERQTPRSSVDSYLAAARNSDFERAAKYLDFEGVGPEIRKRAQGDVARDFKLVLNRALWIDLPTLSNQAEGFDNDGLVENRDLLGHIPLGDAQVPIYLQRMQRKEDGQMVWMIAGSSINNLPALYAEYGDGPIGEVLTQYLPPFSILGMQIWQWVTLLFMIVGALILSIFPTKFIAWWIKRSNFSQAAQLATIITGPVRFIVFVLLLRAWCWMLSLSLEAREITQGYTLLIIAFTWALLSTIGIVRDYAIDWLVSDNKKSAAKLAKPLSNMVAIVVIITAILVWLENLGFQASSIIAGLGIGGLAFALASQKSIENLIAGITLYVSAPVKVGNFCRVGQHLGFVEEIGLRYTRLRTLDRTLVNISNAIFADMELENYSERNRIRYKPQIVLEYGASPEQIKDVIGDIHQMLVDHPDVCEKPCRVRLADYVEYGIKLSILSYVDTT